MKETIVLLLSGATIPLAFFPETLRHIVDMLPFRAVYDVPLTILLRKNGSDTFTGMLTLIAFQMGWAIILTILSNLFWNHSVKKITVNGG